jgi:hypothetical protein
MSDTGMKLEESRVENVLTSKPSASGQQEQYYAYQLRQAKLANAVALGRITGGEETALKGISDLDQLELKALARLYQLGDNSPELLQYFAITKASTREEVASKLAKKQMRKQLVEEAVQKIIPDATVRTAVEARGTATRTARGANGFGLGGLAL